MKKTILTLFIMLLIVQALPAQVASLSHLFLLGRGVKDLDGDSFADKIALCIVIPDNANAYELAVASDIASRANLESLVQDFSLVKRESDISRIERLENPIFIGTNVKWLKDAIKDEDILVPTLGPNQGLVAVFSMKNQNGVILIASSEDALLQTGRAFFLRWPYFWEIWGREEGTTYASLEKDITQFLAAEGVNLQKTIIKSVLYEFPPLKKGPGALKKLSFNSGEIKDLTVEIYFTDEDDQGKSSRAFGTLLQQHQKGQKTDVLSYPGCAQLTLSLRYGKKSLQTVIPRLGFPRRMLTPSFKDSPRADGAGKEFDLLSLLTTKGFYGDIDRDGNIDSLDSQVIIPQGSNIKGIAQVATRLMLGTAGASFPVVYLDKEIENKKALVAPILIGPNTLSQELQRIGKLKVPPLENAWGIATVVPKAFNKSSALVFQAADNIGLEKILAYFNQTFPYLDEYKDGHRQISDVAADLEKFFKGEHGSAESYLAQGLKKSLEDFKDKELESFKAEIYLPQPNPKFEEDVKKSLAASLKTESLEVKSFVMNDGKKIFEKEQAFSWEADDALKLIEEKVKGLANPAIPLRISLGLSESPDIRQKVKKQVEALFAESQKARAEVEVLSAYKQGFFWLLEKVLPQLRGKAVGQIIIRFAEEKENLSRPKRFYSEPARWLQELYPVDEIMARDLNLPLDKIHLELKPAGAAVYEVIAYDAKNAVLFQQSFSPRIREIPYLKPLPEWGTVKLTTGWLRIEAGNDVIIDTPLKCDLEKVWDYYQDEVLSPVYSQILKKTGNEPTYSKQPYFKRLTVELWASEPDFRIGLDEEIVSSLEALHDEIYFDTLDFLRGITELDVEDQELPEDTSRFSAPGNIFPVIHPSSEGERPKLKVTFEDWAASSPQMVLKWKEKGRDESSRKIAFPALKPKPLQIPALIYNGLEQKIESLIIELEFEKENEYLALLDILGSYRELLDKNLLPTALSLPNLNAITFRIKCKDMEKEEKIPVVTPETQEKLASKPLKPGEVIVDTTKILSPEMVQETVDRLAQFAPIRAYIGGKSFEGRDIPVVEVYKPLGKYISIPRLIAAKPTIYLSGRQHANEVSSTSYILKLAELLATDKTYQDYINKVNFVLHPMENPDGAALAFDLQKLTPFHSLHAGRYSSLGIDVGSMGASSRPILPEALVRRNLNSKWQPDIYLNLHGYPSHEWVQQFSNYSPYLFRDYWIPRGWYAIYRSLSLPLYQKYKEAGEELKSFIITEMQSNEKIKESNKKFTDRYFRWAARWQPHLDYLELYDGVNLYAKRRSSTESRLSPRTQVTFVEETPELMDETARGAWLDFLSMQGLSYLRAHLRYLAQAKYETVRFEEEVQDRVRIQFVRGRPGIVKKAGKE
jgi:hypothetical protein